MNGFVVVIPARYASTRLPGKPLRLIAGEPMLRHVYRIATSSAADEVWIATDDTRIRDAARGFGANVCLTAAAHTSGTERRALRPQFPGAYQPTRFVMPGSVSYSRFMVSIH